MILNYKINYQVLTIFMNPRTIHVETLSENDFTMVKYYLQQIITDKYYPEGSNIDNNLHLGEN
jgi:hypothetical protein